MATMKNKQKIFLEIRRLLDSGSTDKQIAGLLSLDPGTVQRVIGVWKLHSEGYTDLAIGYMLGIHQATVGRIRREWTGLEAHVRGRPPEPAKRLGFVNGCYGMRFKVRDDVLARQSCYARQKNGINILRLDGPTDLPRKIIVLSEARRLPRAKLL